MKQLLPLLLFLLPCFAWAQYPSNGNQKITLGEQTTADGLIWRGVASDTTLTAKSDTAAYFVLDTVNKKLYFYKISSTPKWNEISGSGGGGGVDSTAIKYVNTYGTQTVNGAKTFNNITTFADSIKVQGIKIGRGNVNDENNMAVGVRTLSKNTTSGGGSNGLYNTALGYEILFENTTGNQNTGIGFRALKNNTTGNLNVGLGVNSGRDNTTGSNNLAIGTAAIMKNTTGSNNIGIGRDALVENTTASNNIGIGLGTLNSNTTGSDNTAVGYGAGWANSANNNTTGSNNTFIGNYAVGASATASNVITLGNSSIATIRAQVTTITSLSDIRDKTNIMPLNYGINFIKKLNPVSFDWDMRDGGKIGISEIGFIAQELQQAQIDSQINIPNLVSDINPDKLEASYGVLIPIIVKALKEQQALIDELKQRILNLENK
jgi:hypothetical protein